MEFLKKILDLFLHLDKHMEFIISTYGTTTYAILFAIIFIETGLIVMPFLPGDSLLFVVGVFCGKGSLNLLFSIVLLFVAAITGDTVNYFIGKKIGPAVFKKDYRLIKKSHLLKAQEFYEKHGGKTIIIARFIPIIRTFAPFIAGVSNMNYSRFLFFNITGGFIWVTGLTLLGYFFGGIQFVQDHFEIVVFAIIILSILPTIIPPTFDYLRDKFFKKKNS